MQSFVNLLADGIIFAAQLPHTSHIASYPNLFLLTLMSLQNDLNRLRLPVQAATCSKVAPVLSSRHLV